MFHARMRIVLNKIIAKQCRLFIYDHASERCFPFSDDHVRNFAGTVSHRRLAIATITRIIVIRGNCAGNGARGAWASFLRHIGGH